MLLLFCYNHAYCLRKKKQTQPSPNMSNVSRYTSAEKMLTSWNPARSKSLCPGGKNERWMHKALTLGWNGRQVVVRFMRCHWLHSGLTVQPANCIKTEAGGQHVHIQLIHVLLHVYTHPQHDAYHLWLCLGLFLAWKLVKYSLCEVCSQNVRKI